MPQLVGQDSRFVYQSEGRLDRINKGHYKSYLSTITTNLKSLLDAEKETVKTALLNNPFSKSKVELWFCSSGKCHQKKHLKTYLKRKHFGDNE